MLAEVRVTVLLWSREKLARFLDAIFNFAQLQAKGESLDWSALPITCTCFGTFTASKSVSRVWKWGACSSALVVGLIACGYEDLVGEPMNDLRQHVETVFAFSANNMACAQVRACGQSLNGRLIAETAQQYNQCDSVALMAVQSQYQAVGGRGEGKDAQGMYGTASPERCTAGNTVLQRSRVRL
jgi:hypothetical protein